ncbi:MAG: radical SAM protein [Candidatus Margulisiibacteriota bacterium]|nr:radical SAM protein [Candidatus Margulisiibacteriota bacterium]
MKKKVDSNTSIIGIQLSNFCNLNCSYCYLPGRDNTAVMDKGLIEMIIKKIFKSTIIKPNILFLWHFGEPLIIKPSLYQFIFECIEKYNHHRKHVSHNIQTNGLLLNKAWLSFFSKNNVTIGLSIDGPSFIHDHSRKNWKGKGSFNNVYKSIDLLKKNNIDLSGIAVVTDYTLNYPDEFYNFFKSNGFKWLGLNIERNESDNLKSSISNSESLTKYREFISSLYSLYYQDHSFIIREFEQMEMAIHHFKRQNNSRSKNTETTPFDIIKLNMNGDISTFSLFQNIGQSPNISIANINDIISLDDLVSYPNYLLQLSEIQKGIKRCFEDCMYYPVCGGGSPPAKLYENNSFDSLETFQCITHKQIIFDTIINYFNKYAVAPSPVI